MAYREVTMVEIKEVLRQWMDGVAKKRIAARLGSDPKTVRRYVAAAQEEGLRREQGISAVTDELAGKVAARLGTSRGREHGDAWCRCEEQKAVIEHHLAGRVRLRKVWRLLKRSGVVVPYSTLHRFAVDELDFGRTAATVPVVDGKPGEELQVDTGWIHVLEPDETGRRRRVRAWIFTPNVSRYRFVYPLFEETTASAIEACEAAWEFYGGVFHVLVPDNTKAIISKADPLSPKCVLAFLEYSQARGFHVDPTRVRSPKDKARVERSVRDVRDDCFGGEKHHTLEQAREHARRWCEADYGVRVHSSTCRMPKEHFESTEKPCLLPAPASRYDVPLWTEPKVGRDHFAAVAKSLYTLPTDLIGERLVARADSLLVRFYKKGQLVKTHPRKGPGQKSIDPSDFPPEKAPYAMRDVDFLARQAQEHGQAVGKYALALLAGPLPWTRMRRVRALLSLAKKYGDARVDEACRIALAAEMVDVQRLGRMLEVAAAPTPPPTPLAKVIPLARYLRQPSQYALPLVSNERANPKPEGDPK
jgi:transposase